MRGIIAATFSLLLLLLLCQVSLAQENAATTVWQPRVNPLRSTGARESDEWRVAKPPALPLSPLERLRADLQGSDPYRGIAATEELRLLGSEGAAVLLESIANDELNSSVKFSVYRVLNDMGSDLGPALEQVIRGPREKWFHLGPLAKPVKLHAERIVPLLVDVIRKSESDAESKSLAISWLTEMGPNGAPAASALIDLFSTSEDDDEREEVLRALVAIGVPSNLDTSRVLQCLLDQEQTVELRVLAARVLLGKRFRSREIMPALLSMMEDNLASELLAELGPTALPEVSNVLQNQAAELPQRIAAAQTLGRIGANSTATLISAIGQDEELDDAITQALLNIGPNQVIPQVYQFLRQVEAQQKQGTSEDQQRQIERLQQLIVELSGEMGGWGGSAPAAAAPPQIGEWPGSGMSGSGMGISGSSIGISGGEVSGGGMGGGGSATSKSVKVDSLPEWMPSAPRSPSAAPAAAAPEPDLAQEREGSVIGDGARATGAATDASPPVDSTLKLVKVFYATNREPLLTIYQRRAAEWRAFMPAILFGSVTMLLSAFGFALSSSPRKAALAAIGFVATLLFAYPAAQRTVEIERSADNRPGPVYGGKSSNGVELGTCEVTIPATHEFGQLESASLYRFEVEDPTKHIVVRSVRRSDHEEFYTELQQHLTEKGPHVLVFIHGYNVSFDDAARRTAQMACDLKFQGAPIFFSWPSQGNWYEYREDEKQVELAVNPLKAFLLDVSRRSGASSIHLIAHSMGNRALTEALGEIESQAEPKIMFNQVVLAAPDIDAQVFRERIAPVITTKAERVTLYASSNDLALLASRTFNSGDYRAGDASGSVLLIPGIETIDVSEVDSSLLGHSYYGSNPTVLTDLKELLDSTRSAADRPSLEVVSSAEIPYWIFRHRALASLPDAGTSR